MATENRLCGGPRIHGELLKLGLVVSERTVSRYLPDRRTLPSQTWRTFLADHLVAAVSPFDLVTSSNEFGGDDVVDRCEVPRRLALSLHHGHAASIGGWFSTGHPTATHVSGLAYRSGSPSPPSTRTIRQGPAGRRAASYCPTPTRGGPFFREVDCLKGQWSVCSHRSPDRRIAMGSFGPVWAITSSPPRRADTCSLASHECICILARAAVGRSIGEGRKDRGMQYRPHIDGLRTVAIIPVVLFHADVALFPSGFTGVDVFFVISGFLITSLIVEEIGQGRLTIWNFYKRRALRILPTYLVVIAAVVAASWLILLPDETRALGRSVAAASLFVSNIYFWQISDYFAPEVATAPLLHTCRPRWRRIRSMTLVSSMRANQPQAPTALRTRDEVKREGCGCRRCLRDIRAASDATSVGE
jgi:Acyltransferase family